MAFLLIMVAMKYIEGKCEVCHHHVIRGRSQGRAKHVAFAELTSTPERLLP
jgi:hypothetical protein